MHQAVYSDEVVHVCYSTGKLTQQTWSLLPEIGSQPQTLIVTLSGGENS